MKKRCLKIILLGLGIALGLNSQVLLANQIDQLESQQDTTIFEESQDSLIFENSQDDSILETIQDNSISDNDIVLDANQIELDIDDDELQEKAVVVFKKTLDNGVKYALYDNGNLAITGTASDGKLQSVTDVVDKKYWKDITKSTVKAKGVKDISNLYKSEGVWNEAKNRYDYAFSALKTIDLSQFDFSSVTTANSVFYGCTKLTDVKWGNANTTKESYWFLAFYRCRSLKEMVIPSDFVIHPVHMSGFFSGCSSLEKVDFGGMDLSKVYSMDTLFEDCSSMETIDLSKFNSSSARTLYKMFKNCSSLKQVDVSHFRTYLCQDYDEMFAGCSSLEKLDLSSFETSIYANVASAINLIDGCTNLRDYTSTKWLNDTGTYTLPEGDWYWADEDGKICKTVSASLKASKNYKRVQKFQPEKVNITDLSDAIEYRAGGVCPDFKVSIDGRVLEKDIDYTVTYQNNDVLGTASFILKGINHYNFEKTCTYQIVPSTLSEKISVLVESNLVYDGSKLCPKVTVSKDGVTLTEGVDYTVTYNNQMEAKTGTATIVGKGGYTGTYIVHYTFMVKVQSAQPGQNGQQGQQGQAGQLTGSSTFGQPKATAKFVKIKDKKSKKKVTGLKISWNKQKGATSYEIYLNTKKSGKFTKVATVNKKTTKITVTKYKKKALKRKRYYYYVVAKKKDGKKVIRSKVKKKYCIK